MYHGVTLNFGSAKVCSATFETYFSYDKDLWITATDYYMYFYIIVLFQLTAILQLIPLQLHNFYPTALKGCRGIIFTYGVRMGGRAAGKSLSRLYLRNRKV